MVVTIVKFSLHFSCTFLRYFDFKEHMVLSNRSGKSALITSQLWCFCFQQCTVQSSPSPCVPTLCSPFTSLFAFSYHCWRVGSTSEVGMPWMCFNALHFCKQSFAICAHTCKCCTAWCMIRMHTMAWEFTFTCYLHALLKQVCLCHLAHVVPL